MVISIETTKGATICGRGVIYTPQVKEQRLLKLSTGADVRRIGDMLRTLPINHLKY
jgi:hypothetical protein